MTDADLKRLEGAYGRTFPIAVCEFFLNFPPELRAAADNRDPDDLDFHIHDNVEHLIGAITPDPYPLPPGWTSRMLLLGYGGCGECYWCDLDDERGPILLFDAGEDPELSWNFANSLQEYARHVLAGGQPGC